MPREGLPASPRAAVPRLSRGSSSAFSAQSLCRHEEQTGPSPRGGCWVPRLLPWGVPLEQGTANLTQGGHTSRVNELQSLVQLGLWASSPGSHFGAGGSLWDSCDGFLPCCWPVPLGLAVLLQEGSAVCSVTATLCSWGY